MSKEKLLGAVYAFAALHDFSSGMSYFRNDKPDWFHPSCPAERPPASRKKARNQKRGKKR